ncbi:MAG: UPF0175 family protein [Candidatus Kapaibacterium sp.]|nr:UPF0175 family protein [Bacteroidota bacterium]
MKHLILDVPENIDLDETDTKRFLAAKMYESGKLSLGQAAELSALSQIAFTEILADYNVSLINYTIEDVVNDARKL